MTTSEAELFGEATLTDPYPLYAELRQQGTAVRLAHSGVWVVARHAGIRAALKDGGAFAAQSGGGLNPAAGSLLGAVLGVDGPHHRAVRQVLSHTMLPHRGRGTLQQAMEAYAATVVDRVLETGQELDAAELVEKFAGAVTLSFFGLPVRDRERVTRWAFGAFDALGPATSTRVQNATPMAIALTAVMAASPSRETVRASSALAALYAAVDRGEIAAEADIEVAAGWAVVGMAMAIGALTTALRLLSLAPGQWRILHRACTSHPDPDLLPSVFREVLRFDAPVQWSGRETVRPLVLDEATVPAGSRVLLLYGAAGRDRERWGQDADDFAIMRHHSAPPRPFPDALPFRLPVAARLAEMQFTALLAALARRCVSLTPASEPPRRRPNSVLRTWQYLPLRVTATRPVPGQASMRPA